MSWQRLSPGTRQAQVQLSGQERREGKKENLIPSSARTVKIAGLSFALLLTIGMFVDSAVALAPDPQANVRGFYDTLLNTMKNGRTLGQSGRYARLAPVVDRLFDVPSMTRLAVGSSWPTLPAAQQQQLTEAFRHYIAATYANRFDSYSGEQLQVTGQRAYNADVIVETKIVKWNDGSTTLNYLMRQIRAPTSTSTARSARWPCSAPNLTRSSGAKGSTA